jgi:CheY-like chemotaxis protein
LFAESDSSEVLDFTQVSSEINDVGKRPEEVSVQPPANPNVRTPPRGDIPQVLNLAEAALRVLGEDKRTTRAHTLNYLDLDSGQADVRRLYNEIEERRTRARNSVRRVSPLGGTPAEFRIGDTGDPFQTPMQTSAEAVTVPTAGSPTSGPALGKRLRRFVTVPAGQVSLVAETVPSVADTVLSKYFKAFCRQLSRIRSRSGSAENPGEASAVAGPQGGVNLTQPQEPPVRASVLLAIKGAVNQEIAARFLQERGMLVTKAHDWSSALARLEGVTAPDLGKTSDSDPASGRSSWGIDGVGDGSIRIERQKQSKVSPRAQSCLLHENASRAATALGEAPIRRSMAKMSRSKEGGRPFSLVLLDVALMPCALSDAESVDRCLREVHRILGGVEEESDWGNSPPGRGAQNEGTTGVKPGNAAAETESASLLMGSGSGNQPVNRPIPMPHVVWVLGNETPAIVRRLLRSAPSSSIMQKPVFISRLRFLLDNLISATSHTPGTPSEPAVEEGALLAQTPTHRPAMEKPRPGLQVSIPEKPSSEEIVASPSSEEAPSDGTPTSPRSPVHLTPAAQEAMQQFIVAKYKVLVAEDTPLLRQLAKALLTKTMNASVTAVENGQEAVAAIEEANFVEGIGDGEPGGERRAFDFVLMDCQVGCLMECCKSFCSLQFDI